MKRTFQPNNRKRKTHGFLVRMRSVMDVVLNNRRRKGRHKIAV